MTARRQMSPRQHYEWDSPPQYPGGLMNEKTLMSDKTPLAKRASRSGAAGRWHYILFLAALFFLYCHSGPPKELQKEWHLSEEVRAKDLEGSRINNHFSERWIQHVLEHPVQPWDRTGFAEMGLRTRMYLHMLRTGTTPNFDKLERHMWPFIPGIKRIRQHLMLKKAGKERARGASRDFLRQRGIVMSVGSKNVRFAMHFLDNLRSVHRSRLPVEIFYYGNTDLPQKWRTVLERRYAGVKCVDLEKQGFFDADMVQLAGKGWALKPFALIASSFSETLLVDADAVFLSSPDDLFEVKGYKETGTLFFHDRDHWREFASDITHNFIGNQLGTRMPSARIQKSSFWRKKGIFEQESGVVLANKKLPEVFVGLLFAAWQNAGQIRDQTTYRVFWGDKESYWLAFELAGIPYYFVDHYAGGIGTALPSEAPSMPANDYGEKTTGESALIVSEHPLHFYRPDGSTTDLLEQDNTTHFNAGRPIWFNGGLLNMKHVSETDFLRANAWGLKGEWIFDQKAELWSFNATQVGDMKEFDLARTIQKLIITAKLADEFYYKEYR